MKTTHDIIKNIKNLTDLPKLKAFMDKENLTINKSELARELNVDRRTIDKYLNGYKPTNRRNKKSKIDQHYETIQFLLSEKSPHIFYYKRDLWQFMKDHYKLNCSESTFRAYISKKHELQQYFDRR